MTKLSIAMHGEPVTSSMDAIEITYRLRRLGFTQSELARELGVSQSVVSNTIRGRVTCHRVATRIADLLGQDLQVLWPGRYEFKPRGPRQMQTGRTPNEDLTSSLSHGVGNANGPGLAPRAVLGTAYYSSTGMLRSPADLVKVCASFPSAPVASPRVAQADITACAADREPHDSNSTRHPPGCRKYLP